jgi:hypothetical protein
MLRMTYFARCSAGCAVGPDTNVGNHATIPATVLPNTVPAPRDTIWCYYYHSFLANACLRKRLGLTEASLGCVDFS